MQLGEHGHLGPEDDRVDRLVQVVDRPGAVTFENVLVFAVVGRQKDDRHPGGLLSLLDQLGKLEAAHVGHLDVQHQRREFLGDQRQQGLLGRLAQTRR